MTMQPPVQGTVARNAPDVPVPQPPAITEAMLTRGGQKFDIDCVPCHGRSGDGEGMIVQRGFPKPPSLFSDDLIKAKAQHFYDVITNGHGVMYSYADRVSVGRSLGHRRLYPRAATQPARAGRRIVGTGQGTLAGGRAMSRDRPSACSSQERCCCCSACCSSVFAGASAMPSYLADWLFWSSLPLGALPVVMLLDLAGPDAGFGLEPALRSLLWLTPLAGLLMIPVLMRPERAVRLGGRPWLQHTVRP